MTDICTTCKHEALCYSKYPCNLCINRADEKYWEPKEDELETTTH